MGDRSAAAPPQNLRQNTRSLDSSSKAPSPQPSASSFLFLSCPLRNSIIWQNSAASTVRSSSCTAKTTALSPSTMAKRYLTQRENLSDSFGSPTPTIMTLLMSRAIAIVKLYSNSKPYSNPNELYIFSRFWRGFLMWSLKNSIAFRM
jgi:hypothetical protein